MASAKLSARHLQLFEKVVVGQLDAEDQDRLGRELKQSSELRAKFRDYVSLHMDLASAVRMARARQAIYDEIRERAAEAGQPASYAADAAPLPDDRQSLVSVEKNQESLLRKKSVWTLIIAASVAIAVGMQLLPSTLPDQELPLEVTPVLATTKPPAPVATLTSLQNAVWQARPLVEGAILREEDSLELESGEIQLSVGFGAEILAQGPCSLTFLSPERVKLNHGNVAVQVAEWAKGFTVVTSAMDVVDLGTTFTISASEEQGVEARVLEGLVRVHPHATESQDQRGLLVTEGGAFSVDNEGQRRTKPQALPRNLDEIDFGDLTPYQPVDLHNTGKGFSIGDEDPHWKVVDGPAGFAGPQFASVCKSHERYLSNEPESSQWVSVTGWEKAKARSLYTFQTKFDLSGYDLSTIQLFGRFLADNGVQEVRVNGTPVVLEAWIDGVLGQKFGYKQFRYVNVTNGLIAGENVIEVDVWNGSFQHEQATLQDPNPMALRVEWYAFGRHLEEPLAGVQIQSLGAELTDQMN